LFYGPVLIFCVVLQRFQLPAEHGSQQQQNEQLGIKLEQPDTEGCGDEACVPAGMCRSLSSMQKVPSLSDLSDPESSLGKYTKTV
jgi:hypothetical protein